MRSRRVYEKYNISRKDAKLAVMLEKHKALDASKYN